MREWVYKVQNLKEKIFMEKDVIIVKNLSKNYEYYKKEAGLLGSISNFFIREKKITQAVDNISFSITKGEIVGFLGPNGAGKTTTLKILSGIITQSSGECLVLGYIPQNLEYKYQRKFSLVMGQKDQLWKDLPAMDSFILTKEIYGISNEDFKKNSRELIELLGISDIVNVQVRKLSLGQRMKCELVAALLHNPSVLFLDEPTIGLDVVAQKNIRDFLKQYNEKNKTTIMLTSHYMEDIKQLCDRVIIIDKGHIIYDGKLDSLIKKYTPHKILTVTFNGNGVSKEQIKKYGFVKKYNPYAILLEVEREKVKNIAMDILSSNLPVDDIIIDEVEIDDIARQIFMEEQKN